MSYSALGFLLACLFLFICFVLASRVNYKNRFKLNYSLRQHFPYELNYQGKYKDNIYGNLLYAVFFICSVLFLVFFDQNHNSGYLIFALVAGGILLLSLTSLIYISFDHLRLHMIMVAISFIFSLSFSFSIVLASYYKYKEVSSPSAIVSMIMGIVAVLAVVILLLNPRLAHWADMDKETKEDGTVVMKRPKWFVLAYSEWALFFIYLFSYITLLVETI